MSSLPLPIKTCYLHEFLNRDRKRRVGLLARDKVTLSGIKATYQI